MSEIVKTMTQKSKKTPAIPRPSSSVLLVSPNNQILLLHRVQTSTSFASAHVFPGGNVSEFHDGRIPEPDHPERHVDQKAYRMAAIRETFEESGILLAKQKGTDKLLAVDEAEREKGRKLIHAGKISFPQWLKEHNGIPDIDNLIPFTRWITPPMIPKRYTTQMYLYLLPLSIPTNYKVSKRTFGTLPIDAETVVPVPTHDGGVEHTAARFLAPASWIAQAQEGKIVLYTPQFFLLSMVAQYLKPTWDAYSTIELERQRRMLELFVKGGDPPWRDVCISPVMMGAALKDERRVLTLEHPGREVESLGRRGVRDYVVLVGKRDGNPDNTEVKTRRELSELIERKPNL